MPRRGDILLHSGSGFVARMIKRITRSKYSHAAWMISETEVLESDWALFGDKGVQVNEIERYSPSKVKFVRPKMDDQDIEAALGIARNKIGQRYDFSLIFFLLFKWVLSLMSLGYLGRTRNQRYGWICSELVATPCYAASRFKFHDDISVEEITPGDIDRSENVVSIS